MTVSSTFSLGPDNLGRWFWLRNTGSALVDEVLLVESSPYGGWDGDGNSRVRNVDLNGDGISDILLGPDNYGRWFGLRASLAHH